MLRSYLRARTGTGSGGRAPGGDAVDQRHHIPGERHGQRKTVRGRQKGCGSAAASWSASARFWGLSERFERLRSSAIGGEEQLDGQLGDRDLEGHVERAEHPEE